jgi:hypothetical protein
MNLAVRFWPSERRISLTWHERFRFKTPYQELSEQGMKSKIPVLGSTRGGLFWFSSTRREKKRKKYIHDGTFFYETTMKERCGDDNEETMRKRLVGERRGTLKQRSHNAPRTLRERWLRGRLMNDALPNRKLSFDVKLSHI